MDLALFKRALKLGVFPALTAVVGILVVVIINKYTDFSVEFVQFLVYVNLVAILIDFGFNDTLQYTHKDLVVSVIKKSHLTTALIVRSCILIFLVVVVLAVKSTLLVEYGFAPFIYLTGAIFNFDSFALGRKSILYVKWPFILSKIFHLVFVMLMIRYDFSLGTVLMTHSVFFLLSNLIVFKSLWLSDSKVSNESLRIQDVTRFGMARIVSSFSLSSATVFLDIYGFKQVISDFYLLDKIRVGFQGVISGIWIVQRNVDLRIARMKTVIAELVFFVLIYLTVGFMLLVYLDGVASYLLILISMAFIFLFALLNMLISNNLLFYSVNAPKEYFKIIRLQSLVYLFVVVICVPTFAVWGMISALFVFEFVYFLFLVFSIPYEDLRDFLVS